MAITKTGNRKLQKKKPTILLMKNHLSWKEHRISNSELLPNKWQNNHDQILQYNKTTYLCTLRDHSEWELEEFYDTIEEAFSLVKAMNIPMVMGDLNASITNPKEIIILGKGDPPQIKIVSVVPQARPKLCLSWTLNQGKWENWWNINTTCQENI